MSTIAIKWARTQYLGGPKSLKSVLNALAVRADNRGRTWVSQAALAADCSMTDRTVRHALAVLERLGVITREVRSRGRKGRLTDVIELAIGRSFHVAAAAIRAVKASLKALSITAERAIANARTGIVNLPKVPTGNPLPGNTKSAYPRRDTLGSITTTEVVRERRGSAPRWRAALSATASWLWGCPA